jgi:hypothetical protein
MEGGIMRKVLVQSICIGAFSTSFPSRHSMESAIVYLTHFEVRAELPTEQRRSS